MDPRAQALIREIGLEPHPEGGWYRETFRSPRTVTVDGVERSALTTICFLLARGEHSRWHRVAQDEAWHAYEGDPLELLWLTPDLARCERRVLGRFDEGVVPVAVVPARCWQAARPLGDYALVGCTMGPGFEFADMELLASGSAHAATLRARFPELADRF